MATLKQTASLFMTCHLKKKEKKRGPEIHLDPGCEWVRGHGEQANDQPPLSFVTLPLFLCPMSVPAEEAVDQTPERKGDPFSASPLSSSWLRIPAPHETEKDRRREVCEQLVSKGGSEHPIFSARI